MGGQHLLLFAMNSMLGFDKLALNYSIDSGCPVVFCRAASTARLQALAAGQPFFYADFWWTLAERMRSALRSLLATLSRFSCMRWRRLLTGWVRSRGVGVSSLRIN